MSSSAGGMLSKEEESNAEVRREDQENINKFGRLNARMQEIQEERAVLKKQMESYDDASTELMMMSNGDNIMLHLGNAFFETSEDTATDHCENEVERMQTELDTLENEEGEISDEMKSLKSILYGRFGKSINLEA